MKKKHCYKKRGSDIWHKSNYANFCKKLRQDFCILTAGYTKSYHSEKSLKTVNNTPTAEISRLLILQNCQMICKPYYWDKQHANISPLVLMTDWLMAMHCSQKTTFHFLKVFNVHTSILPARNHFCGICFNSHKYFQDIFETDQRPQKDVSFEMFPRGLWDVSLNGDLIETF